jgi:hypothetical protein
MSHKAAELRGKKALGRGRPGAHILTRSGGRF